MVSLHKIDELENLEFKQKTEIVSVSFYPSEKGGKAFGKVIKIFDPNKHVVL